MTIKLYFDYGSQPSRAVYLFLKINGIPFEEVHVSIAAREHRKDDYRQINPFQLVPAIDDNGFILTESVAILKYLARKYNAAEHWYPTNDPKTEARIEEYAHWQHLNTRIHSAMLFQNLLLIPRMKRQPINWENVKTFRTQVGKVVSHIDKYFLRDKPFLCGNEITIADILGICELIQLYSVCEENLYESNPNVKSWMERVKKRLGPEFEEAHHVVYSMREMFKSSSKM